MMEICNRYTPLLSQNNKHINLIVLRSQHLISAFALLVHALRVRKLKSWNSAQLSQWYSYVNVPRTPVAKGTRPKNSITSVWSRARCLRNKRGAAASFVAIQVIRDIFTILPNALETLSNLLKILYFIIPTRIPRILQLRSRYLHRCSDSRPMSPRKAAIGYSNSTLHRNVWNWRMNKA